MDPESPVMGHGAADSLTAPIRPPEAECPKGKQGQGLPFKEAAEQARSEWLAICSSCRRPSSRKDHGCPACDKKLLMINYDQGFSYGHGVVRNSLYYTLYLCCPACRVAEKIKHLHCPHCGVIIGPHHIYDKRMARRLSLFWQFVFAYPFWLSFGLFMALGVLATRLIDVNAINKLLALVRLDGTQWEFVVAVAPLLIIYISIIFLKEALTRKSWAYAPIANTYDPDLYDE